MSNSMQLIDEAQAAFDCGNWKLAKQLFEEADGQRNDQAALMLGWIYESGWNVPVDIDAALLCYRRAAVRGSSQGGFYLGRKLLEMGHYDEALHFLRSAANTEPAAAHTLGRCTELPLAERLFWLDKGVDLGNVYCLALSGRLLLRQSPFINLPKAIWRIASSFAITTFVGISYKNASDLKEDKRFQK